MIWSVVANLLGIGGDVLKARADLKLTQLKARADIEVARAAAAARTAEAGALWEQRAVEASATSWKDEWFTIVLSIPLILSFIPGARVFIEEGFVALDGTPDWYQWSLMAAISFAFGRRVIPEFGSKKKE